MSCHLLGPGIPLGEHPGCPSRGPGGGVLEVYEAKPTIRCNHDVIGGHVPQNDALCMCIWPRSRCAGNSPPEALNCLPPNSRSSRLSSAPANSPTRATRWPRSTPYWPGSPADGCLSSTTRPAGLPCRRSCRQPDPGGYPSPPQNQHWPPNVLGGETHSPTSPTQQGAAYCKRSRPYGSLVGWTLVRRAPLVIPRSVRPGREPIDASGCIRSAAR